MEALVVYVTAPSEEEGAKIGRILVEERLAGCVNIVRDVRSIYRWQGAIEDDNEVLMVLKTRRDLFDRLKIRVSELHSYTVPEVIAVPVAAGLGDYLKWLGEVTG